MNSGSISSLSPGALRVGTSLGGPGFNAAALRHAPPEQQRKAVAGEFEAIFVRQLLDKTMNAMFGAEGGTAGSVYGGMLGDVMAQQLTSGPGLGLGRFLEQQLKPAHPVAAAPAGADPAKTSPS